MLLVVVEVVVVAAADVAIEVDGPSHFYPIWGYDNLQKHITADAKKSGLLLGAGLTVIRVANKAKTVSKKHERDTLKAVLEVLAKPSYP